MIMKTQKYNVVFDSYDDAVGFTNPVLVFEDGTRKSGFVLVARSFGFVNARIVSSTETQYYVTNNLSNASFFDDEKDATGFVERFSPGVYRSVRLSDLPEEFVRGGPPLRACTPEWIESVRPLFKALEREQLLEFSDQPQLTSLGKCCVELEAENAKLKAEADERCQALEAELARVKEELQSARNRFIDSQEYGSKSQKEAWRLGNLLSEAKDTIRVLCEMLPDRNGSRASDGLARVLARGLE